tara:strand:+ start:1037 stop:1327 length:291 start_codon:yes stop_codon:yes gene_type:complete
MTTITLRVEDCDQVVIDQIVIDELIDCYDMNNQFDKVDDLSNDALEHITGSVEFTGYLREPDYELLKAIQTVLAYYMPHKDYEEWMEINPMVKEDD